MATPAVGVLLQVFIGKRVFKAAAMQGEGHDISSSESVLWQLRQEQLVDDAFALDSDPAFRRACRMGRHHDPALLSRRPHRQVRAVVEGARETTFRMRKLPFCGEMQSRLDSGMVQQQIVFPPHHVSQASQISEDSPGAILPIESQEGTFLRELVRGEVAPDSGDRTAQFLAVVAVARVSERTELCGIKTDMSRVIELAHPFPLGFLLSAVFPIQPYAF
jgi:hypothetical protein